MGSVDAEVEIDMEISDDERESSKARAMAGLVVDGRGVKRSSAAEPELADKTDSGRKRKRSSSVETSPSVRVEYRNLSRESRKKLQEVLRDWSLWQGYYGRQSSLEARDHVESGEEEYYPAMQVGPIGNSFSVAFWVDKPAKQARSEESGDTRGIVRSSSEDLRENEADVPLYDRVTPSLSSSQELNKDRFVELEREAARCFNCGSYSHALRECKRQRNYETINSARSNHAAKRSFSSGSRSLARYYEAQHSNENQEPDRTPWQHYQTGEHGQSPSNSEGGYTGKEASRNTPGMLKKPENNNKVPSNEENEEGEIVDGVGSPCDEEELYIAFSPDAPSQGDSSSDFSGARIPYNSPPERMWRSPPAYSPPNQLHPNYLHHRPFTHSPPGHVYPHTPSPVLYNGMHPQRAWDERQPHRSWEEWSPYYPENSVSPAVNVPSAPIAIPAAKKEDDDWELNFESSVYQSESSRSHAGVPVATDHYTPTSVRHQALTVNTTITGFSPPDPSQLSPTGSGYGESFRPSPVPQTSVQYHFSYHTTPGREPTSYSTEAWEKAQAALSSLQSDGNGDGC